MGQAAVDLPDTPSPPNASAASTDDLLAQMAGEEIDRLLAESDERPAAATATPGEPLKPQPFLSPAPAPPENAPESDASQLRGFLGGLADDPGPDPVAELAHPSRTDAAKTPAGENRPDPLDDLEASTAERAALSAPARAANADGSVSLLVRVLAWINSPLDSCPDHVREAIGKIAILTAVNAMAVLAYVLFFRHH